MPAPTPGYVKNMIRRSFSEVLDPSPTKKDERRIWEFFNHECAYCGKKLDKNKKEGHIDHLVSSSCGGRNNISNRVLSCATCNEKEKLDMDWHVFLKTKNPDRRLAEVRKLKIVEWQKQNKLQPIDKKNIKELEIASNAVIAVYDEKIEKIRNLKK